MAGHAAAAAKAFPPPLPKRDNVELVQKALADRAAELALPKSDTAS